MADASPTIHARDAQYAPMGNIEKHPSIEAVDVASVTKSNSDDNEDRITDLFVSFPEVKGIAPETNPLTVRAVLTGIVLGSLVNASNVYLGMLCPSLFNVTYSQLTVPRHQVSRLASPSLPTCSVPSSATV